MKVRGPFGEITLIDDSYNANPTSMAASLALLGARTPGPGGRRVAVLGEMLELGEGEVAFHAGLAAPIAAAGVDQVFCAGVKMNALWAALPVAARGGIEDTAAALWPVALAALRDGDVVLVKGSNGSKVHTIAARLKDQAEK